MNLPTQAEVNAAARHIGTFAAGAIAMFGLSTKIDPATVQSLITGLGNLTNDVIFVIGIVAPIITSYYASKSATPQAQAASLATTGAKIVTTPEIANAVPSPNVMSATDVKVVSK